jgi:hypothetical protein
MFRSYFNVALSSVQSSDQFQKIVYHLYDTSNQKPIAQPVFIHYLGCQSPDELNSFKHLPHGNNKDKNHASSHQRTLPSVLSNLKSQLSTQLPINVYRLSSKNDGPRNVKQCRNIRMVT